MVSTMVSTRGVKFKFSEGEKVLCYEPDPTKAKVLYASKVLDLVVSRDSKGRKAPEYLIHFYGWNSSWDRCVKEEFILPYTEENKDLQTRLAEDAAVSLKGKRKSKLPPLIKETLSKKPCMEEDAEESKEPENPLDSLSSDSDSSEEEMDSDRVVTITIPDVLRRVLEEDGRNITQRDKFVKLPCEVNVITILENYVKYRAANLLCAAPPKNGNNGKQLMPEDVENKLNLCKEAMDGIRIYFDFTLPHLLLYRHEKKQYYTVGTTCLPYGVPECEASKEECGKIKKELDLSPYVNNECHGQKDQLIPKIEPEVSPPKRGRPAARNKPLLQQSPETSINGYASSKLRNRTPPSKIMIQKSKRERQPKAQNQRRILRSNDKQKSPDISTTATTSSSSQDTETNTTPRPESPALPPSPTRQTRKSILNNPSPPAIIPSQTKPSPNDKFISNGSSSSQQCSQPPPSLSLVSNGVTSSNSSTHSSLSSPVLNEQQYHLIKNSGLLQEVSSWRMLPEYLYEQVPAAPSLIYGAQHLLRLFVKLPDLISKMNMSQRKLDLLLDILENFLQYLAEQEEELFQAFAYVDSNDVFPDSSGNK